jgi:diguanylate cyclase (GGDEF)-like protein
MKPVPIAILFAISLAAGWPSIARGLPANAPGEIAALDADATPAQIDEGLSALAEWLDSDFGAARPTAAALLADDSLPVDLRARIFLTVMTTARTPPRLDFETEVTPAYRALVDQLPAGSRRADVRKAYGNLHLWRGQFVMAESLYLEAQAEYDSGDPAAQADVRNSIAVSLAQQGRLDEALATMLEAYRLFEQTEAGPSINLLRNIGGLSIYLEEWEQAETFTRRALDRSEPDDPLITGIYSNLAAALTEQGKLDEAREALLKALEIGEALGQPNSSAISNLGYVLREQGQTEAALARFQQAAALDRQNGDTSTLAITLKNVGETLIQLGRRQEADAVLQESLALYRQADIKPKRLELYPVLVDNLEALGRYPEALAMMREHQALKDEIVSSDTQTRVAELRNAFDLERKQRELAESERQRLAGEAQLASLETAQTRQRHLRTLLITGVIGLILILGLLLRMLRLRSRANRLLADKNAQIDAQHHALVETNEHLRRQSVEDELTGLGNRRSIRELLTTGLPEQLAGRESLLLLIDLDRFKGINDQFGHPVGDRVLIDFAQALRAVAQPEDVIARWGGEEFLWVVANAGLDQAADHCEALARQIRSTEFRAGDRSLSVTASIGAAVLDLDADNPQAAFDLALKIADAALYEAKNSGRNSWTGFERRSNDPERFRGTLDVARLTEQGALVRRRLQSSAE